MRKWVCDTFWPNSIVNPSPVDAGFIYLMSTNFNNRLKLLFFKVNDDLNLILRDSWNESINDTLKIIFYTRDIINGNGNQSLFEKCIKWVIVNYPDFIRANLHNISKYGSYQDYWLFLDTPLQKDIYVFFAKQLKADFEKYKNGENISNAAKEAPVEGCYIDKKYNAVSELCKYMEITKKEYRQDYINTLKKNINSKIINSNVGYNELPYIAFNKYQCLLENNNYISNEPNIIIENIIKDSLMWNSIFKDRLKSSHLIETVVISMEYNKLSSNLGTAIGILLSQTLNSKSKYYNNIYLANGEIKEICDLDEQEQIDYVMNELNCGYTSIEDIYESILNMAIISEIDIPECVWVMADHDTDIPIIDCVLDNFEIKNNYKVPTIIYWNFQKSKVYIKKYGNNIILIEGFNKYLWELFLHKRYINDLDYIQYLLDNDDFNLLNF